MELLSSADLAEAVGEDCLNRAKEYYIGKIKRNGGRIPNEYECWRHVYLYYHDTYDGCWPRMNAIKIKSIRDVLEKNIELTRKELVMIVKKYNIS